MKKTTLIVMLVLLISLVIGSSLASWYLTPRGMMGMMSWAGMGVISILPVLWIVIAVSVIGLIGSIVYYLAFPEIKNPPPKPQKSSSESYEVVLRFLKDDEKKIVEFLRSARGESLQKDIAKQTGFSRIKTHRIIVRLVERGVVAAERQGNTNRIKLLIQ